MTTSIYGQIIPDNDQTAARRENLARLARLVGNTYPNKFRRWNVTNSAGGEDTITSLVNPETLARVVGDEGFADAFAALSDIVKAGGRPSQEEIESINAWLKNLNNGKGVRVAGRLSTPPRVMGKAAFVHLSDGDERLQIYVRKQEAVAISNDSGAAVEEEESGWKLFQLLDHGDFAGVEGFLFVTKTGELSVHVRTIQFLSKALLPMPDKMHGISDPEVRQRQRYADLLASSLKIETGGEAEGAGRELSTREVFERRSKMIREMRRHLDEHGYIEVETPMLSPIASGAAARPFKTHHNALDIDLYARVAPELYLKRLLVGGFERVYELNRNFRNEGISTRHNPEFTMLEFYCAYMDADGMMDFCQTLIQTTVCMFDKSMRFPYSEDIWIGMPTGSPRTPVSFGAYTRSFTIDFSSFKRLSMREAINDNLPDEYRTIKFHNRQFDEGWLEDPLLIMLLSRLVDAVAFTAPTEELSDELKEKMRKELLRLINLKWPEVIEEISNLDNIDESETANHTVNLFETLGERNLTQPTFVTDFPKPVSPLSKASPDNPAVAERFELYIAGMECANGFSELNDPAEQLERFEEQARQRERGDEETMQTDTDYVRALAYGMPPAAGIGIGVDRLAMLLTNRRSIRDVILFPHMRPPRSQADETPPDETGVSATEVARERPAEP